MMNLTTKTKIKVDICEIIKKAKLIDKEEYEQITHQQEMR